MRSRGGATGSADPQVFEADYREFLDATRSWIMASKFVPETVAGCRIEFGDCDPAGIVFYPNFQRWMDAASLHFFVQCGVAPWRELVKT